jgi:hypothetical protein
MLQVNASYSLLQLISPIPMGICQNNAFLFAARSADLPRYGPGTPYSLRNGH